MHFDRIWTVITHQHTVQTVVTAVKYACNNLESPPIFTDVTVRKDLQSLWRCCLHDMHANIAKSLKATACSEFEGCC